MIAAPILAATTTGQGPAVVCLHGQPGSAADWTAVAHELSGEFSVTAVDRLGYGRTGGQAGGFTANADAVIATLDHLGIDRAVMVAHSWGGGVALALATQHPERVGGLVLVSSVGPGGTPSFVDRVLAAPVLGDVMVASTFAMARTLLGSAAVRAGLDRVLPGASRTALGAMTGAPEQVVHGTSAVWRSFLTEQRAYLDEIEQLETTLGAITAPCAVIFGTSDRIVAPDMAAHLAATIAGAKLQAVPGAGHLLPFDHPAEVASEVRTVAACSPGTRDRPAGTPRSSRSSPRSGSSPS